MKDNTVIVSKRLDNFSLPEEQIRIRKIRVKALETFALRTREAMKDNDIIPIGKHRALAHQNNPCADENDIGLLTAYLGERCIGYLGIMPGLLRRGDRFSKVHWLSTWYVVPELRKTSVGLQLLLSALSLKYDFVVCAMSYEAERVYRALRFSELGPLNYYVISFDILNLLSLSFRALRKIVRRLGIKLEIFDKMIRLSTHIYSPIRNALYDTVIYNGGVHLDRICYEEVRRFHGDAREKRFDSHSTEFYRGKEIINWMLKYKWTTERDKAEIGDTSYYFAEIRDVMKFISLSVYSCNGKEYRGFLILSFSRANFYSVLKILDFGFHKAEDRKYVVFLALKYARTLAANYVELPESLIKYVKDSFVFRLLLSGKKRIYLSRPKASDSPLATFASDINLNYCDGDTPFT